MEKIKAAIFDVDGTLFDYKEKKIHESTKFAISKLKQAGIVIIIASGRSYPLLGEEVINDIMADYYVLANGHSVLDGAAREVFSKRFTFEQTEYVVQLAKQYNDGLMLKYNNTSCIYTRKNEMFEVFNNIGLRKEDFIYCEQMNYHHTELPIGFTIRGSDTIKRALCAKPFEYRVELFSNDMECDVFSPNTNKMTSLKALMQCLDIDAQSCIAYGDSRNDIEMIQWAGNGIAMGNACAELKNVANSVCDVSWQNGIYKSLSKYISM